MRKLMMILAFMVSSVAQAEELKPWQKSALKEIKAEKTVLDAYWRSAGNNILYVSRKADGSLHTGFAEYLCSIFSDHEAPNGILKTVWIFDPQNYEQSKTTSGENMGLAACR